MKYYARDGQEITIEQWMLLMEGDFETTRRVAYDEVGERHVSTVWLGLDHSYVDGDPPAIFETMVFDEEGHGEIWDRYSSEEQARVGHFEAVTVVRATAAGAEKK